MRSNPLLKNLHHKKSYCCPSLASLNLLVLAGKRSFFVVSRLSKRASLKEKLTSFQSNLYQSIKFPPILGKIVRNNKKKPISCFRWTVAVNFIYFEKSFTFWFRYKTFRSDGTAKIFFRGHSKFIFLRCQSQCWFGQTIKHLSECGDRLFISIHSTSNMVHEHCT